MREKKPKRRRIEPRELLRQRGVIFEAEVEEWLRDGRLYVYRDAAGEPRAFYVDEELLQEPPWWAGERQRAERRREAGSSRHGRGGGEEARRELKRLLDRLS